MLIYFWESLSRLKLDTLEHCISTNEAPTYIDEVLTDYGLDPRERQDLITYWISKFNKQYVCFSIVGSYQHKGDITYFNTDLYDKNTQLTIEPIPDVILRIMFASMCPINISKDRSDAFWVVEWGGGKCDI